MEHYNVGHVRTDARAKALHLMSHRSGDTVTAVGNTDWVFIPTYITECWFTGILRKTFKFKVEYIKRKIQFWRDCTSFTFISWGHLWSFLNSNIEKRSENNNNISTVCSIVRYYQSIINTNEPTTTEWVAAAILQLGPNMCNVCTFSEFFSRCCYSS